MRERSKRPEPRPDTKPGARARTRPKPSSRPAHEPQAPLDLARFTGRWTTCLARHHQSSSSVREPTAFDELRDSSTRRQSPAAHEHAIPAAFASAPSSRARRNRYAGPVASIARRQTAYNLQSRVLVCDQNGGRSPHRVWRRRCHASRADDPRAQLTDVAGDADRHSTYALELTDENPLCQHA